MKKALIVYAHPEPKSFVNAMKETIKNTLLHDGWSVTVSDLYEKNFNPVASKTDFSIRADTNHLIYPLEQRNALKTGTLAADIEAEVELIVDANLIILVFPIFWFSMPAILKGWVDRVFLSGPFYGGRRVYDYGGMTGKKAMIVAALGGRKHMFGKYAIHGELTHGMLRHITQGTLGYTGFDVLEPFFAYHVPYIEAEERSNILDELTQQISDIGSRPKLQMPSLNSFDNIFRPKSSSK